MATKFFPLPEQLFSGLGVKGTDLKPGTAVEVDGGLLAMLISCALESIVFNKEEYLKFEDIKAAHEKGMIANLQEHYTRRGFFEGRALLPHSFDAKWYQRNYPDVKLSVDSGKTKSAQDHYMSQGYREWRAPSDGTRDDVAKWRKLLSK